ncbi:MAG: hypothetical protein HC919_04670 [Oscillatoriales cyanobacterium SM2_2_1]|nr:hypothetical protein [Oscillatoriales cyanobacterium SM2_2_1]
MHAYRNQREGDLDTMPAYVPFGQGRSRGEIQGQWEYCQPKLLKLKNL